MDILLHVGYGLLVLLLFAGLGAVAYLFGEGIEYALEVLFDE